MAERLEAAFDTAVDASLRELETASMELGKVIYEDAAKQRGAAPGAAAGGGGEAGNGGDDAIECVECVGAQRGPADEVAARFVEVVDGALAVDARQCAGRGVRGGAALDPPMSTRRSRPSDRSVGSRSGTTRPMLPIVLLPSSP